MRKQLIVACLITLAALLDSAVFLVSASMPGNKHLLGLGVAALAIVACAIVQWIIYGRAVIKDAITQQRAVPPVA